MSDTVVITVTGEDVTAAALASQQAAAASATAAKTSETNSKISETNSKTSESNALIYANQAAESQVTAASSANAANLAAQAQSDLNFATCALMNADLAHAAGIKALIYADKYVAGKNSYTISSNFVAGDTVAFDGITFTAVASSAVGNQFVVGSDTTTSATNLTAVMNANTTINTLFTATSSTNIITITDTALGGGNTPGTMLVTGTGVISAGTAIISTSNGIWIKQGAPGAGSWQKSLWIPPVADKSIKTVSIFPGAINDDVMAIGDIIINKGNIKFDSNTSILTIAGMRYKKRDGSFIEMPLVNGVASTASIALTGEYDYIMADCSGSSINLYKGTKTYFWQEINLLPDVFVLLYSNAGFLQSRYANVNEQITPKSVQVVENGIEIQGQNVTVKYLRAAFPGTSWGFHDLAAPVSFTLSNYEYLIMEIPIDKVSIGEADIQVYKGTKAYPWNESLSFNKSTLLGRNGTDLYSPHHQVQNAIDKLQSFTITRTEKVVKVGGTIGTDCDFTDINTALDTVSGTSLSKVVLRVLNGTYDVSSDGRNYTGMKNYVDIIGQSRSGVQIVRRMSNYNAVYATFDPVYYGSEINRASLRNMTIISNNCKCPVHIDGDQLNGTIEVIDCDLINENPASNENYQNALACGLRQNQHVIARGVRTNGTLWAHNSNTHYLGDGCSFELYNCISRYIQVGDLLSYGKDKFIAEGCRAEYLKLRYYKDYGGQLSYVEPSWEFQLRGNKIERILATYTDNIEVPFSTGVFGDLYGGKWGIADPSIHAYCKNTSMSAITRGTLLTLDSASDMAGVKAWSFGNNLYGVALDNMAIGDFGIVQDGGFVPISADGSTSNIAFNDPLELNSSGIAVKRVSGDIVGYARAATTTTGTLQVKLV
ncbi:hypothetical protein Ga0466249_002304 [Sporomusaceae bacterium BoRhaA]|uniref:hypothetical protein n=1 Tax=Pelorhabdus rhamnosifermentans TaxID=2772457 RepID=UPI001C060C9A|nr:hypothetical protein [Pelorhabdus rhamnosifermentans]MBU2701190.1 hypothetical protein [Pelorhabdus rhamnosifermentans]